ncbi:MAG: zinc ribbon domain-containing protein [Ruminococcus sp.]|nr:zinc ribbon domain-containing protein [Ruminococcus sp.]
MSKFCTACGAALPDDATFCTSCGTPQQITAAGTPAPAPAQTYAPGPQGATPAEAAAGAVKEKLSNFSFSGFKGALSGENIKNLKSRPNKYTIICLAGIAVVVIAVIIILLTILLGGGYKKPVDNLVSALETGKGEYYIALLTEPAKKDMEKEIGESKKYDNIEEYYDDYLSSKQEKLEDKFGKGFSISYSIDEKKELSEIMLKSYASAIKSTYGKKADVTDGYILDLDVSWSGKDDNDKGEKSLTVLKVDGDWILADPSPNQMMPRDLGGSNNGKAISSAYDALDGLDDLDLGDLDDVGDLVDMFS